ACPIRSFSINTRVTLLGENVSYLPTVPRPDGSSNIDGRNLVSNGRAFTGGDVINPDIVVSGLGIIFHRNEALSIGRKSRLTEKARLPNRADDFPLTIEHRELPQLRRRNSNHKSINVTIHAGRPRPDWSRFRRTEQQLRLSKFKIGRSRNRNDQDSSIGP